MFEEKSIPAENFNPRALHTHFHMFAERKSSKPHQTSSVTMEDKYSKQTKSACNVYFNLLTDILKINQGLSGQKDFLNLWKSERHIYGEISHLLEFQGCLRFLILFQLQVPTQFEWCEFRSVIVKGTILWFQIIPSDSFPIHGPRRSVCSSCKSLSHRNTRLF